MSFLTDNDAFSKFLFLLLLLIGFVIILNGTLSIIELATKTNNPYLVYGSIPGNKPYTIKQDPTKSGSIPISRSDNKTGIEMTWSVWVNITDVGTTDQYQTIFHKGELYTGDDGLNTPNNAPGVYLAPGTNELIVLMNTYTTINEEVKVPNFPMNKWVNIVIRVMDNALDVYINGSLSTRHILSSVPKQNYGDVYVGSNGGFSGTLSNLRYYNYALQPPEILDITNKGPNLKEIKTTTPDVVVPPYLSVQWYTN